MPNIDFDIKVIAEGLEFPEGPVALRDGSVLVAELAGRRVRRVGPKGDISVVAETGGSPCGLAIGPDGAVYICNNGGLVFSSKQAGPSGPSPDYRGGYIQRLDLRTGTVSELYSACGGRTLSSPNDLVFDSHGGFYFTDMGKRLATYREHGGVYYAMPDGSRIEEVIYPLLTPNGIALSADEDRLYVAQTEGARLYAYDIERPGKVTRRPAPAPYGGEGLAGLAGVQRFDSMAVDSAGNICVGTLDSGVVSVISPAGDLITQIPFGDSHPTNICFGGADNRTAYVTLAETGRLVSLTWPVPGRPLNYNA